MKKSLLLFASFFLVSCAKEEFSAIKGIDRSTSAALSTDCGTLYAQSTLISPKVDVLLLWDNSSSALFINQSTKNSFNQMISSVSEKFDFHILSAPLVSINTNSLFEASLVTKKYSDAIEKKITYDDPTITGSAVGILRSKVEAASALNFSSASGSYEPGVDRATSIIEANRNNGIFRNDAYTIIVVMSNGDDTSCEISNKVTSCVKAVWEADLQPKIDRLLCLRGNAGGLNCSGVTPLNSTMMRFINIAPLTKCSSGLGVENSRYRKVAKSLYDAPYTNGWPTSNDNLNPFTSGGIQYPDNYDICSIDFNHVFDGVNTAIQQTLIKHVYEFWPVAGTNTSLDPNTLTVKRISDGKVLTNRTGESNPIDGFQYIGNQTNHPTRTYPAAGENFTGKMIQLFGTDGNDKVQFPQALSVCYQDFKLQYGYIYLNKGKPDVSTLEVYIDGVKIPQNATNGWDYMGPQQVNQLDLNYKIFNIPTGASSGYFLRLNGSAKRDNTTSASVEVFYISAP